MYYIYMTWKCIPNIPDRYVHTRRVICTHKHVYAFSKYCVALFILYLYWICNERRYVRTVHTKRLHCIDNNAECVIANYNDAVCVREYGRMATRDPTNVYILAVAIFMQSNHHHHHCRGTFIWRYKLHTCKTTNQQTFQIWYLTKWE